MKHWRALLPGIPMLRGKSNEFFVYDGGACIEGCLCYTCKQKMTSRQAGRHRCSKEPGYCRGFARLFLYSNTVLLFPGKLDDPNHHGEYRAKRNHGFLVHKLHLPSKMSPGKAKRHRGILRYKLSCNWA